ncbi:hypothetical protein BS052_RS19045 [Vibrio parahaemolyticus]|uniref:hypothetical protein n=1 Tax=Vibrio harveyi group TaxID=717610 RepID=UPI0003ED8D1F|nr:hypothetical protein [Vibrio parahaemolyticus]AHJ02721.1 hypothetical protein VPUCM_p0044 [Vibrio parahaemolyticus UCM-V493]EGR1582752.1 hypothetical protein [Vibrio parahaemolyticus]EGR1598498.1 hypothetical protein [Vibrio parahaemolyticus]EGR1762323.1 hypothetical protein [Vibrio parahaemolyticus]EGR3225581.1 hypothetical protein [Vibrio parahaemolyticus]
MAKFTEEQKLSLEAGEFIHGISNLLLDGDKRIYDLPKERIALLAEISHLLRVPFVEDTSAPGLCDIGFFVTKHPRSVWVCFANLLIDEDKSVPIKDLLDKVL